MNLHTFYATPPDAVLHAGVIVADAEYGIGLDYSDHVLVETCAADGMDLGAEGAPDGSLGRGKLHHHLFFAPTEERIARTSLVATPVVDVGC